MEQDKFSHFLFFDVLGELTWILLYGGLGYWFGSEWELVYEFINNFGWLIVGLVIGLMQALTQIQEATLIFAPKIIAVFVALIVFLPLMGALLSGFMRDITARIAEM